MEVQVSTEMLLAPSLFMGKALPGYQEPDLNTHSPWPCPRGPPCTCSESISGPGKQNSSPRVEHIKASLSPKRGGCH